MSGEPSALRLVLVGLSGVGKSAAGNTILGREEFKSEASPSSLTLITEGREGEVCGRRVLVVDTPGLFNSELSDQEQREQMQTAVSLCDPGPHAFLLVIQLGRFTQQEKRVVETLKRLVPESVNQPTVVLFTYGDRLRKKTVQEVINNDTNLQQLLLKCGNQYHVLNNQQMENRSQVFELLKKIDKIMDTSHYATDRTGAHQNPALTPLPTGSAAAGHYATDRTGRHQNPALTPLTTGSAAGNELRIVLLGKTGVGKSTANAILGPEKSDYEPSTSSLTKPFEKARGKVDGRDVAVIDLAGLFDSHFSNPAIMQDCISLSSPGPHVFLVVVQLDGYAQVEHETMKMILNIFPAESLKYTMVLFTHGNNLKEKTIEEWLSGKKEIAEFIDKCRGGYHVFNDEVKNPSQVSELLEKIDKMVTNNGGRCYNNEMYEKAEKAIEEKKQQILREQEEARKKEEEKQRRCLEGEALQKSLQQLHKQMEANARREAEIQYLNYKREKSNRCMIQ